MNEYQLVEVNYLNQLRLAALELSEVKTELSDLREDNATLRRELDKAKNGITLREAREANKEWLLLHGAGDEPDLREIAERMIAEDREGRQSGCDPECDSYPGDCGHCDPDCPRECSATLESCAPARPHESLVWAIFYATASGATEDPFGCADRDLETWRSRWPEDEAA